MIETPGAGAVSVNLRKLEHNSGKPLSLTPASLHFGSVLDDRDIATLLHKETLEKPVKFSRLLLHLSLALCNTTLGSAGKEAFCSVKQPHSLNGTSN